MIDKLISFFTRSVKSSFRIYENSIKNYFMKFKNASRQLAKAIRETFRKIVNYIIGKPTSIKDYFKLGTNYVSKPFLLRIVCVTVLVVVFGWKIVIPFLEGKLWTPTIVVNSQKYHQYEGNAKVIDTSGKLLYLGKIVDSYAEGFGEIYSYGNLVYRGEIDKNKYNGEGTLYQGETVVYSGNFLNNLYDGTGKLYNEHGNLLKEGTFKEGHFIEGIEYYPDGHIKYNGVFQNNEYSGSGKLYTDEADNTLVYKGEFSNGLYNGTGTLYEDNRIVYDGAFINGEYDGEGILYAENSTKPLYAGNFSAGLYSGEGKLYYDNSPRVNYEGLFDNGKYNGNGVLYGKNGTQIFKGPFFDGHIDFAALFGKTITEIREAFGTENEIYMLDNSFITTYNDMQIAFEFDFAQEGELPVSSRVKIFGDQSINGIQIGMTVDEVKAQMQKDNGYESYTEYEFFVTDEDMFFFNIGDIEIYTGEYAFSAKYIIDDIYYRVYTKGEDNKICYYEMGGV